MTRAVPAELVPWKRPLNVYVNSAGNPETTPVTVDVALKVPSVPIVTSGSWNSLPRLPPGRQPRLAVTLTSWMWPAATRNVSA